MFSNEEKRTVEIVKTKNELLEKLQEMRKTPDIVERNQIYILSKHVDEFHSLNRDEQIDIITTHGIGSFIKTLLFKETPIEKSLRRMELSPSEQSRYEAAIKNGDIVIISGSDPFNEQRWTGHTLNKWITNRSNASNLIDWNVKDERVIPFTPKQEVRMVPEMGVASDFGQASPVDSDEIPLKDNQRYVRHPKTKVLSIYQGPHPYE
ncbi:serine/threonine protein kinase [Lysinibacillus sp. 2017]|uniref:general stress protein n=1 Tax=unclassified Lysinibacillus TaxID=2636778 RepID=UPI000D528AF8|nr:MULTISPECIES: general stress protein [unclassified Lysinibacillus]AWE06155.1 serine/threonine protein kinase [Lysinibacillus sp. 2017]TGN35190.1 serine/threonine protein kinase [Lysinibacillus sp. S2017]